MTPFLQLVARAYLRNETGDMSRYCFVFPNKRSAIFFNRYLQEEAIESLSGDSGIILPEVTTIDQLVSSWVPDLTRASRYDQLFTIYNAYRRLVTEGAMEFDRFRFWGEMLIADFNEIDQYDIDADALLTNLYRYREIGSTFITDEQRELIKKYWGEEKPEYALDQFWTHLSHDNDTLGEGSSRFMKLWELLKPLYHAFNDSLQADGLASAGRIYRRAVKHLAECGAEDLECSRYVMVGFNVLSTSEHKIFSRLKALGAADFYWDVNSPVVSEKSNKIARHLRINSQEFTSLYELDEPTIRELPPINITGIPSNTGQAKFAAWEVQNLIDSGAITDCSNAINTAIVLPDESLLPTLLHSIPTDITSVNVTMGLPMRNTPIASLLRRIVSLHMRARKVKARGEHEFFYEDIISIASHPLLKGVASDECSALTTEINEKRLYTIPASLIEKIAPGIAQLIRPVDDKHDFNKAADYLDGVIKYLRGAIEGQSASEVLPQPDEEVVEDDEQTKSIEFSIAVLDSCSEALADLRQAVERYGIIMEESTALQMFQAALSTESIHFNGEPLRGLQVMGMLETRALDFDNVIILSMNERIFPKRMNRGSFIPEAFRRAFGMATIDFREATYAYYFFRLLSRAKQATLLYDSRTIGTRSGEKSRYLTQLLYLFNHDTDEGHAINHTSAVYKASSFDREMGGVEKTPRVMEILSRFLDDDSNYRLSASAINEYINCPLSFYLTRVERLAPPDEITDYIDFSTYGSIVHNVLEELYISCRPDPKKDTAVTIDKATIERFLRSETMLDRIITRAINTLYNKATTEEQKNADLQGETYAIGRLIKMIVKQTLREEMKIAPFIFIGAEVPFVGKLVIPGNPELRVNYRQVVDRVDRVDGQMRIVDYKTGADKISFTSVDQLFDSSKDDRRKAILQLLLYCNMYAESNGIDEPIQPIIYKLRDVNTSGINPIKFGRQNSSSSFVVSDYRTFNDSDPLTEKKEDGFLPRLHAVIREIFDPDTPFNTALNEHSCTYCKFKAICCVD